MNQYFSIGTDFHRITRETPKTYYYHKVLPTDTIFCDYSIMFVSMASISFKLYLNSNELDDKECKILKSKFNYVTRDTIDNLMWVNNDLVTIDEEFMNNHFLFSSRSSLELSFILKKLVSSLTSNQIKAKLNQNCDYSKKCFNEVLNKLKLFHKKYGQWIQDNMTKIKYTMSYNTNKIIDFDTYNNAPKKLEHYYILSDNYELLNSTIDKTNMTEKNAISSTYFKNLLTSDNNKDIFIELIFALNLNSFA